MIKRAYFITALLLLIGFSIARGDTTDHYSIYYNDIEVRTNSIKVHDSVPLEFNKKNIGLDDKLTVKYSSDSLCSTCKYFLVIIDSEKKYVKVVSNSGQGTPLTFSLNEVLDWSNEKTVNRFDIYYYAEKPAYPIYLFTLNLYE
jgi:hypothetical protein